MRQILIDQFTMPQPAVAAFKARRLINNHFISGLPGFGGHQAYQYTEEGGNFTCITLTIWESPEALEGARQAVSAHFKREGFDLGELMETLHIHLNRKVFRPLED